MPCIDAMIDEVVSLPLDITVEEALNVLDNNNIRTAPVLDSDKTMLGLFGYETLMQAVLPQALSMGIGLGRLDFARGAGPDIARRLRKVKAKPLAEVMNRKPLTLQPEMSLWETIRTLAKARLPLAVVDKKTNKFLGIVTERSAIAELERSEADPTLTGPELDASES